MKYVAEDRTQIIRDKIVVVQPKEILVKSSTLPTLEKQKIDEVVDKEIPKVIFKDSITPIPTITDIFGLPECETSISYDDLLKSSR